MYVKLKLKYVKFKLKYVCKIQIKICLSSN